MIARPGTSSRRRETFLQIVSRAARDLAADRSTKFLPVVASILFFITPAAIAMMEMSIDLISLALHYTDADLLSFTLLYSWMIPAVIFASLIGTFQLRSSTGILKDFEEHCAYFKSEQEAKLTLINDREMRHDLRVQYGGLNSWRSDTHHMLLQTTDFERRLHTGPRNWERGQLRWRTLWWHIRPLIDLAIPVIIVLGAMLSSLAITIYMPPIGLGCRTSEVLKIFSIWFGSYLLSLIPFGAYHKARFRSTFAKDTISFLSTMVIVTGTDIGVFHQCSCYTQWGQTGLQLPQMPMVSAILENNSQWKLPLILSMGILFQLVLIPGLVLLRYDLAIQVYMQRDDTKGV